MPFVVYILQSKSSDRFYGGQTHALKSRVSQHNSPWITKLKRGSVFDDQAGSIPGCHSDSREKRHYLIVARAIFGHKM